ncbi:Synaptobrevin family protein [Arabidopsis thaliana]|uniref:Synaptobrevin family protein n=1 Tax=Arabidopsis thaliana TaxID=3702 RepID=A0A1I9LSR3_ARATH|nr:Synaptobrevin family protein [Arabidopsis thaliana]NP_001327576.1 Synaptobrevin family protein [Arabidopsis thaliana]NP_001327577.1 Synaptobrevin family protein [Arabidopsis thaliana]ANM65617.1 Synaptobrevin family protein [Arabidopsis thaliana]ANM65619.1 Synaptobrevin family protein [Arabidopsis thaliana]ANM65621.1 Synaptobrevin family protein [Arabidopsis thaliana]|eukprot:NP_001327574.1 Synaptobrevin family protein [Arabidopsis thaliana]
MTLSTALDRSEKIELLVDKIREPLFTGTRFQSARNENDKMWFQNMKIKLIVLGIIIFLSVNSHRHHRVNSHNSHIALQVDGKLFPGIWDKDCCDNPFWRVL